MAHFLEKLVFHCTLTNVNEWKYLFFTVSSTRYTLPLCTDTIYFLTRTPSIKTLQEKLTRVLLFRSWVSRCSASELGRPLKPRLEPGFPLRGRPLGGPAPGGDPFSQGVAPGGLICWFFLVFPLNFKNFKLIKLKTSYTWSLQLFLLISFLIRPQPVRFKKIWFFGPKIQFRENI